MTSSPLIKVRGILRYFSTKAAEGNFIKMIIFLL